MKTARFLILTILLTGITAFHITGTVVCMERNVCRTEAGLCRSTEKGYLKELREELENQGYTDCGITMTRVTKEDEAVEYTVRIHHRRIRKMDEDGKTELKNRLTEIALPPDGNTLVLEFYVP